MTTYKEKCSNSHSCLFATAFSNVENDPTFSEVVDLDLSTIKSCVSGPKRPQDKVCVDELKTEFRKSLTNKIGFNVNKNKLK